MEKNSSATVPRMATIPEAARLGVLPEHVLRTLLREGRIHAVYSGTTPYINVDLLISDLNNPTSKLYNKEEK